MSKRYAIWDKKSDIITPSGRIFTAEQWMDEYPVARIPSIVVICAKGDFNGGIFDTLGSMKQRCEQAGFKFADGLTDQEILDAIEAIEDELNSPPVDNGESTPDERIAAALEFQNAMSLPVDETLTDPDMEE